MFSGMDMCSVILFFYVFSYLSFNKKSHGMSLRLSIIFMIETLCIGTSNQEMYWSPTPTTVTWRPMKSNKLGYRKALYANLQILVKADPYYIKLQLFTTTYYINPPEAMVGTKKLVSYSLEELKYGDIWSFGMLLFMLLNPDQEFPYSQEMEDLNVESASEAKDVIGKLMDKKKKPAHSTKYDSLRVAQWSYINEAYEMCTSFQPSQRASAHDVLTVLCQGNLKKFNEL